MTSLGHVTPGAGFQPPTVQTGIIAILIGLALEERPALSIVETGSESVLGWNGTAFAPVQLLEDEGLYTFF